jgi:hypothetical protein
MDSPTEGSTRTVALAADYVSSDEEGDPYQACRTFLKEFIENGTYERPFRDKGTGKRVKDTWYFAIEQFDDDIPRMWRVTPLQAAKGHGKWSCPCRLQRNPKLGRHKANCPIHKHDLIYFTEKVAAKLAVPSPQQTLAFADFEKEMMAMLHKFVFAYKTRDSPLWGRGTHVRGTIAERVVRRFVTLQLGWTVVDAKGGKSCNGAALGKGHESYDFCRILVKGSSRRIEVKNARLHWETNRKYWVVIWVAIKAGLHETLMLSLETPTGFEIYKRGPPGTPGDGGTGLIEDATGKFVTVCGPRGVADFDTALAHIRSKLVERGDVRLGFVPFTDPAYASDLAYTSATEALYPIKSVPLADLSGTLRGAVLEELIRLVLSRNFGNAITAADVTLRVDNAKRGRNCTTCDFKVDGEDAEAKSSQMGINTSLNCVRVTFSNLKMGAHARRYLAMYTPRGVHLFDHTGSFKGVAGNGKCEEAKGKQIQASAPHHMLDPVAAEAFLLKRLVHFWDIKYIAFVEF